VRARERIIALRPKYVERLIRNIKALNQSKEVKENLISFFTTMLKRQERSHINCHVSNTNKFIKYCENQREKYKCQSCNIVGLKLEKKIKIDLLADLQRKIIAEVQDAATNGCRISQVELDEIIGRLEEGFSCWNEKLDFDGNHIECDKLNIDFLSKAYPETVKKYFGQETTKNDETIQNTPDNNGRENNISLIDRLRMLLDEKVY